MKVRYILLTFVYLNLFLLGYYDSAFTCTLLLIAGFFYENRQIAIKEYKDYRDWKKKQKQR